MNRKDLREYIAKILQHMIEITATGGDTTSVTGTGRLAQYEDEAWRGAQVLIQTSDENAPHGETSWVTAFSVVTGTGTLTLSPALSAGVEAGDTVQLYTGPTVEEINDALARAAHGNVIATSLTPSTTSVDYYLGEAIGLSRADQILGVFLRDGGHVDTMPQRIISYQVEDAEGELTLRIPFTLRSTDLLWIEYRGDHTYLTSDTAEVNLPPRLVLARVGVELCEMMMQRPGPTNAQEWGAKLRYWQEALRVEERKSAAPTGRAIGPDWGDGELSEILTHPLWRHIQ